MIKHIIEWQTSARSSSESGIQLNWNGGKDQRRGNQEAGDCGTKPWKAYSGTLGNVEEACK